MVFERLPKIVRIEGGATTLTSDEIVLDNHRAVLFLLENTEGNSLTVKIKANTEDGTSEAVPFLFRSVDTTEFEGVDAEGKTITAGGAFVAAVTSDSLGRKEFDRVAIDIESGEDLTTVYALLTQARYEDNE